MPAFYRLGTLALVGCAVAGCSQITVTSRTIVDGAARIADATTNATRSTSNATTNKVNGTSARTHAARVKFVRSQYNLLKREAARGAGEDLDALAYMMHARDKRAFEQKIQAHYQALFAGDVDAGRWLGRLYKVVGTPPDMRVAAAG